MSEFSNILSQFIHEKSIKVYPLSKYCNFDRATMYKIINGKRNPPSQDIIDKMSDFMKLTPTEYEQFKEVMKFPELDQIIIIEEKVQKIFSCIFRISFLSVSALFLPQIPASKAN